jgi:hypothetical protein
MSERILERPVPVVSIPTDARHLPVVVAVAPLAPVVAGSAPAMPDSPARTVLRRIGSTIARGPEAVIGAATLIVGLAVLAAIPILQLLSLGYLLESAARVAQTGRVRDGFIGLRPAARIGSLVAGTWLILLPLRLVSALAFDAQLIDPNGPLARRWATALTILTGLAVLHIVSAWSRGGKLRYFFWPFNSIWLIRRLLRGGYYAEARDAVWDFLANSRLPYYFWLGLRGFIGTFLWLALPITLIALGSKIPRVGFLLGLPGALLLMLVVLYLPFLQVRFAVENRLAAMFELRAVRARFRRAPWAFAIALAITLLFALPLYLLKIEMIPREAAWLPSLVFVVFIFQARLLTGWAYARSQRRSWPRHWFLRWTGRLALLPVVAMYVLVAFFTQYAAWEGVWSLYEQHAFLLPVPFLGS